MHGGRRQPAHQLLGGGDLLPAVAACEVLDQPGALGPEPGGAQRVVPALAPVDEPQGLLGELQGALALAAERAGDGRLGQQVEIAQRARVAASQPQGG